MNQQYLILYCMAAPSRALNHWLDLRNILNKLLTFINVESVQKAGIPHHVCTFTPPLQLKYSQPNFLSNG